MERTRGSLVGEVGRANAALAGAHRARDTMQQELEKALPRRVPEISATSALPVRAAAFVLGTAAAHQAATGQPATSKE